MYKIRGTIFTDVYKIGRRVACKINNIHPSFTPIGIPFTDKGVIYVEVKRKKGLHS